MDPSSTARKESSVKKECKTIFSDDSVRSSTKEVTCCIVWCAYEELTDKNKCSFCLFSVFIKPLIAIFVKPWLLEGKNCFGTSLMLHVFWFFYIWTCLSCLLFCLWPKSETTHCLEFRCYQRHLGLWYRSMLDSNISDKETYISRE